jgi:ubiquinone/menaquinone biosynthesis C-methylase UbiE
MKSDWNKLAEEYTRRGMLSDEFNLGYLTVLELLGEVENVLDFGCGSGKFSRKLRDQGKQVIALDPTEEMIKFAKERDCSNIEYHTGTELNFLESESLEGAISTFVFCTVHEDQKLIENCQEIYRVLKTNSPFIILDPHPNIHQAEYISGSRRIHAGRIVETRLKGMEGILYDCLRPIQDYKDFLELAGFKIDAIREPGNENAQYLVIKGTKK